MQTAPTRSPVRLLHLSDVHVGLTYGFPASAGQDQGQIPLRVLASLPEVTTNEEAALVVIAGDFFDHNRVARSLVSQVWELLDACPCEVVILPGNHDPFMDGSPYAEPRPDRVHVFSRQEGELLAFPEIGVECWGQAHTSYGDFVPCGAIPQWSGDADRWKVAIAHGHFVEGGAASRFSYQIRPRQLEQLNADYVALGHWDFLERVPAPRVNAWYSGSPCRTHSFARIDLGPAGTDISAVQVPH